mmetsp:Transcript_23474/g.24448  ORF Transcript_23474/g.24448 Transcript_23474/m.24448 type:complete len:110 (-) Transcript_23474:121-450(-)
MAGYFEDIFGVDYNYGIFASVFFTILIGPFYVFSYARVYLQEYYSPKKTDIYAVAITVAFMWFIIMSYAVFYFSEDFYKVFCKKEDDKETETELKNKKAADSVKRMKTN